MYDRSSEGPESTVVKAKDKFLKKRFRDQYLWEVDADKVARISEVIFGELRHRR